MRACIVKSFCKKCVPMCTDKNLTLKEIILWIKKRNLKEKQMERTLL